MPSRIHALSKAYELYILNFTSPFNYYMVWCDRSMPSLLNKEKRKCAYPQIQHIIF